MPIITAKITHPETDEPLILWPSLLRQVSVIIDDANIIIPIDEIDLPRTSPFITSQIDSIPRKARIIADKIRIPITKCLITLKDKTIKSWPGSVKIFSLCGSKSVFGLDPIKCVAPITISETVAKSPIVIKDLDITSSDTKSQTPNIDMVVRISTHKINKKETISLIFFIVKFILILSNFAS